MKEDEMITRIKDRYPDAEIDIKGADCNFELVIVSTGFADLGMLQRQKTILGIFSADIQSGALHALSIKALTPEEQSKRAGQPRIEIKPAL